MSTAMAAHIAPSFGTVVQQQMRLLWVSRRVLFLNTLILVTLIVIAGVMTQLDEGVDLLLLQLFPGILGISGIWGFIIWRDEAPQQRTYHWSLPVDMAAHDVARVCAGAIWLFATITLFLLVGLFVVLIMGDVHSTARAAPLLGLQYLLGPITLYLLVAAWTTALNRAAELLLLSYLGLMGLIALLNWLGQDWFLRTIEFVAGRPYGIAWVLVAAFNGAAVRIGSPERAALSVYLTEWLPFAVLWLLIAAVIVGRVAIWRRGRA